MSPTIFSDGNIFRPGNILTIVLLFISWPVVLTRLWVRKHLIKSLGGDDVLIVIAQVI
jgi:hypothetical protein